MTTHTGGREEIPGKDPSTGEKEESDDRNRDLCDQPECDHKESVSPASMQMFGGGH